MGKPLAGNRKTTSSVDHTDFRVGFGHLHHHIKTEKGAIRPKAESKAIKVYLDNLLKCTQHPRLNTRLRDNAQPKNTWVSCKTEKETDQLDIRVTRHTTEREGKKLQTQKLLTPLPDIRRFWTLILTEEIALALIWLRADVLMTYSPEGTSTEEEDVTARSTIVKGLFKFNKYDCKIETYLARNTLLTKVGNPNANKVILERDHYDEDSLTRMLQLFDEQTTFYVLHKERSLELRGYEAEKLDKLDLTQNYLTAFKRGSQSQVKSLEAQMDEEKKVEHHFDAQVPEIPTDRTDVVAV